MKFKSQVMTQASGSIGGTTYSHNRGGMYTRARAIPTNPNSIRQQAVRSMFGLGVQAWTSTLTQGQRDAWTAYADATPVTNVFGDQIVLTGQQMFLRGNVIRAQAGLSVAFDGPTVMNTGVPVGSTQGVTATVPDVLYMDGSIGLSTQVNLAGTADEAGVILLFLGRLINSSRKFYKGPYQLSAQIAFAASATTANLVTVLAAITAEIPPVIGQFRSMRLVVSYNDGRLSQPFEVLQTIADDV